MDVYPVPGFVIAILTTWPPLTVAVPINCIFGVPVADVDTPTFTIWTPSRYPDPLFPILIAAIVPAIETVAVPPAETRGWYPNPSVEPIEARIPPRGIEALFTS